MIYIIVHIYIYIYDKIQKSVSFCFYVIAVLGGGQPRWAGIWYGHECLYWGLTCYEADSQTDQIASRNRLVSLKCSMTPVTSTASSWCIQIVERHIIDTIIWIYGVKIFDSLYVFYNADYGRRWWRTTIRLQCLSSLASITLRNSMHPLNINIMNYPPFFFLDDSHDLSSCNSDKYQRSQKFDIHLNNGWKHTSYTGTASSNWSVFFLIYDTGLFKLIWLGY